MSKANDSLKYSLYQIKSGKNTGKWVGAAEFPRSQGEKRERKTFYGNTEKEANSKLHAFIYEYEHGEYIIQKKDTLIAFLNNYYDVCKSKWQNTTKELYRMYIDVHFEPYFKDIKLINIKPLTLDTFYNYKLDGLDGRNKPMSINTVRKLNSFLKSAFDYAVKNDYIRKNPADNVVLAKKEKYKPTILKEDQFLKLFESVKNTDDEIPIILGAGCGLRRGEIFGLTWNNVDLDNKTITIEKTTVRFNTYTEKKPKNETSKRTIKVPDYVIDTLRKYKPDNIKPSAKIITRWKPQAYSERFKLLLEKYDINHIRLHDLRHFNAILMLKYGVPDKVAAERLGHAQVSTLRDIYQHVLTDMDESAANEINTLFK